MRKQIRQEQDQNSRKESQVQELMKTKEVNQKLINQLEKQYKEMEVKY